MCLISFSAQRFYWDISISGENVFFNNIVVVVHFKFNTIIFDACVFKKCKIVSCWQYEYESNRKEEREPALMFLCYKILIWRKDPWEYYSLTLCLLDVWKIELFLKPTFLCCLHSYDALHSSFSLRINPWDRR